MQTIDMPNGGSELTGKLVGLCRLVGQSGAAQCNVSITGQLIMNTDGQVSALRVGKQFIIIRRLDHDVKCLYVGVRRPWR